MTTYTAFGTLLKQLRKERGYTAADLAHAIGRTERTISNLENGSLTTIETLLKICEVLQVSPNYFLSIYVDPEIAGADDRIKKLYQSILELKPSQRKFLLGFIHSLVSNRPYQPK